MSRRAAEFYLFGLAYIFVSYLVVFGLPNGDRVTRVEKHAGSSIALEPSTAEVNATSTLVQVER